LLSPLPGLGVNYGATQRWRWANEFRRRMAAWAAGLIALPELNDLARLPVGFSSPCEKHRLI
jgi:hypothetical protein